MNMSGESRVGFCLHLVVKHVENLLVLVGEFLLDLGTL